MESDKVSYQILQAALGASLVCHLKSAKIADVVLIDML